MGLVEARTAVMLVETFTPTANLIPIFQDPLQNQILSNFNRLDVPRGAKGTIKRMSTILNARVTGLDVDRDVTIILGHFGSPDPATSIYIINPSVEQIAALKPMWIDQMFFNHNEVTAAGVTIGVFQSRTDVDYSKLPAHRGQELKSFGAISNDAVSWEFLTYFMAQSLLVAFTAIVDWEIEYLESSKSLSETWDMDEVVEMEAQEP